jgi:hypothetical protein
MRTGWNAIAPCGIMCAGMVSVITTRQRVGWLLFMRAGGSFRNRKSAPPRRCIRQPQARRRRARPAWALARELRAPRWPPVADSPQHAPLKRASTENAAPNGRIQLVSCPV